MRRSERLWWGLLAFWLLLLWLNVLGARGSKGFWVNIASEILGAALAVFNIIRVRRGPIVNGD